MKAAVVGEETKLWFEGSKIVFSEGTNLKVEKSLFGVWLASQAELSLLCSSLLLPVVR